MMNTAAPDRTTLEFEKFCLRRAAASVGIFTLRDLALSAGYSPRRIYAIVGGHDRSIRARKRLQEIVRAHVWKDLPPPSPAGKAPRQPASA